MATFQSRIDHPWACLALSHSCSLKTFLTPAAMHPLLLQGYAHFQPPVLQPALLVCLVGP